MSGKFSRSKGRREEQQLVLHLAKLYYKAERILRQYQAAGQPDVIATKNDKTYTFELKSRNCSFKTVYDLYQREMGVNSVFTFITSTRGVAVAMSTDFEALLDTRDLHFKNLEITPPAPKDVKVYKRIIGFNTLRQSADFLVIRDNNKPRLFIKYWA